MLYEVITDLAYLGPLPYVSLRSSYPNAEPLVHFLEKNGQASYSCALISAGEKLPHPLRDKTFALTQPLSRITSYNVCYTKLLRDADHGPGRPVFVDP